MLVELSMVEQRHQAVREVLDTGASVTDVATRYGVDRRTLHRWLVRYANEGLAALAESSSKPDRCPHQIEPEVEARIVELRRAHPGWGPRTILNKLRRELEVTSRSRMSRSGVPRPSGGASIEPGASASGYLDLRQFAPATLVEFLFEKLGIAESDDSDDGSMRK